VSNPTPEEIALFRTLDQNDRADLRRLRDEMIGGDTTPLGNMVDRGLQRPNSLELTPLGLRICATLLELDHRELATLGVKLRYSSR
jgi:hypothetical protein